MKIAVIGTGYVGLVSAVGFAKLAAHEVVCVDMREDIVERINRAEPTLHEADLPEMLKEVVDAGLLRATTDYREAMDGAELALICVGTPYQPNGAIDLSYIDSSARSIGEIIRGRSDYIVVAVKSTVVPGTTEERVLKNVEEVSGKRAGKDFGVAMTPEFLREGVALDDFLNPDRLVLGALDDRSFEVVNRLYDAHDCPKVRCSLRTAEMTKYVANAYLALHISFANEIALLCERVGGIDVRDVLEGVYLDHRHSPRVDGKPTFPLVLGYFAPNCGYGGSCFPKDVMALEYKAREMGLTPQMLESVTSINRHMPLHLVERVDEMLGGSRGAEVAVLGLAFKPGTDDVRESPAIPIVTTLAKHGAKVRACDPLGLAVENFQRTVGELEGVEYTSDVRAALRGARAACLVTPWDAFDLPASEFKALMAAGNGAAPLFYDGRCKRSAEEFTAAGLRYAGIGYGL